MARGMVSQTKNGVSVPWLGHPGAILRHPVYTQFLPQLAPGYGVSAVQPVTPSLEP